MDQNGMQWAAVGSSGQGYGLTLLGAIGGEILLGAVGTHSPGNV
jgi:hypothetical protein